MVEDYPECSGPGREAFVGFHERHFLTAQRFECGACAVSRHLSARRSRDDGQRPTVRRSASVPERFRARMANWDCNLLQGLIDRLKVREGALSFADRSAAGELPTGFTPLRVVGPDCTTAWRGIRGNGPEKDGTRAFHYPAIGSRQGFSSRIGTPCRARQAPALTVHVRPLRSMSLSVPVAALFSISASCSCTASSYGFAGLQ